MSALPEAPSSAATSLSQRAAAQREAWPGNLLESDPAPCALASSAALKWVS